MGPHKNFLGNTELLCADLLNVDLHPLPLLPSEVNA